jgi:mevalonate kinase
MITPSRFSSHGKLLLAGEYLVLDGARALALPTKSGQSLEIYSLEGGEPGLRWKSQDVEGHTWFEAFFSLPSLDVQRSSDPAVSENLHRILWECRRENSSFLTKEAALEVTTRLEFPRLWGLGTSSTLIANLAAWAKVDPYSLLFRTMGGSGYDIACARAEGAISYQLNDEGFPIVKDVPFSPPFLDQLFFIYLEKKQNSREGINRYRASSLQFDLAPRIQRCSAISLEMTQCDQLSDFGELMEEHEQLISGIIGLEKVKDQLFSDFPGWIKSLGAWGGDFVLVASEQSEEEVSRYFKEKGFGTCLSYSELIL